MERRMGRGATHNRTRHTLHHSSRQPSIRFPFRKLPWMGWTPLASRCRCTSMGEEFKYNSRERRGIILGYVKNHPATFFRKIKKLNERCTQKVLVKIPKIFSGLIPSGCSRFENAMYFFVMKNNGEILSLKNLWVFSKISI